MQSIMKMQRYYCINLASSPEKYQCKLCCLRFSFTSTGANFPLPCGVGAYDKRPSANMLMCDNRNATRIFCVKISNRPEQVLTRFAFEAEWH